MDVKSVKVITQMYFLFWNLIYGTYRQVGGHNTDGRGGPRPILFFIRSFIRSPFNPCTYLPKVKEALSTSAYYVATTVAIAFHLICHSFEEKRRDSLHSSLHSRPI